jgi:NADH-quinone oxidoreductase subunit H
MVYAQYGLWNVVKQPLGLFIFLVAVFAETNRLPFDLPEAETELVAGYHTEYAGMKFAMFFMAEYANMVTASALVVTLFFGGWMIPFVSTPAPSSWWLSLLEILAFSCKVAVILFLFVWVRWTIPRFRYDQLMMLGWKVLLPLALLNIFVTAGIVALT